ncbi:MAG: 50S ribosomal protein L30 [Syntrophales bacterium]|nr:50S ribosomal protein L30 [Syntrophales bacterium]
MVRVTLVKSPIGRPGKQREVLRGMGLGKVGRTVSLKNTPEIKGMIRKVIHMVSVEEYTGDAS